MQSEAARRMMDAARERANEIGKPVSVAIVDAAGNLMALERRAEAPSGTVLIAEGKAVASVVMGRDSIRLEAMARNLPSIMYSLMIRYDSRFVPAQGASSSGTARSLWAPLVSRAPAAKKTSR
jgi:uncharacterized protein GlcG (DUF336 family)